MSQSKRENRKYGNQESSKEASQEGSQEAREEEVTIPCNRQHQTGGAESAPRNIFSPAIGSRKKKDGAPDDLPFCDLPGSRPARGRRKSVPGRRPILLRAGRRSGSNAVTRRRWIADSWDETTASLTGAQASHLIRVLRAQSGMEFDIVAGDRVWRSVISGIVGDQVRFTLLREVEPDRALPVTLLISIFKFERMEWIVEKATELGAERLVPIIARRSDKHLAKTAPERVERWRRIAREAAQQSRRSDVPAVDNVIALREAAQAAPTPGRLRLLLAEQERATTLRGAMAAELDQDGAPKAGIEMAVGPEGGWTAEEEALFTAEGWKPVSLGPRILRAETAAVAAMAVVAALLE